MNKITISKRFLLSFSIGSKYRDKVLSNVVAIDACHLLFGRTWQYDKTAIHDGKNNTYSFMFDNTKIVLPPSKEVEPKPSKGDGKNILARKEFVDEIVGFRGCISIIGQGE